MKQTPYEVVVDHAVLDELSSLRVYDHRRIVEAIERHLRFLLNVVTRRRKPLVSFQPEFEHVPPIGNCG